VQHEGIATHELGPDPKAVIKTPNGTVLKAGDPVITYVARNLEPYRGFHIFMRALAKIQQSNPTCHAVILGGDEVSYGKRPNGSPSWREHMLREVSVDAARTHFLGRVPRAQFVRAMQVSALHVYLTYPFVLSWSLIEAMACGTPVVASSTAPVLDIGGEMTAKLVPFFDTVAIARSLLDHLRDTREARRVASVAHARAQGFNQVAAEPRLLELLLGQSSPNHELHQVTSLATAPVVRSPGRIDLTQEERTAPDPRGFAWVFRHDRSQEQVHKCRQEHL